MTFLETTKRFAIVAAAVASLTSMAPAAQAASTDVGAAIATNPGNEGGVGTNTAPPGVRCGAYVDFTHLWYKHCGDSYIEVEVDKIKGDNVFICIGPWEHKAIASLLFYDNAWYTGRSC
ncbi:DUF6355 family natural product biosynthesis protein [Nonomuraea zeae]|uniref:Uncharacterized protein n=1 Tax=Nonomuraea zeae TaxID=1642303 RepID=A0A5S4FJT8_9ACTN|nr:DUF6355 family natural product biosynthesis protein [Nonomuraea zeae]TMR09349.1 hypothetical protein ETD85_61520 [Nonomuraea zeae]